VNKENGQQPDELRKQDNNKEATRNLSSHIEMHTHAGSTLHDFDL